MVTVAEAARLLERSPATVRRYVREGRLPAERRGGRLFISRKDLLEFSLRNNPGSYPQLGSLYFIEDDFDRRDRVLHLLRSDAVGLMHRLLSRKREICAIWSRERLRRPFLQTLRTRFHDVGFETLLCLSVPELRAFQNFYDEVERLTWYLEYTQDMPTTLERVLEQSLNRIRRHFVTLMKTVGGEELDMVALLEESDQEFERLLAESRKP
ncbi:MAG: DNA-binding protein [Deltaproteobacteria bacterium]|nr:MAG: DNA-binding protein [Deltaproteobacteria bacterium]